MTLLEVGNMCAAALTYASDRNWTSFPVPPGTKKSHLKAKHSNGVRWGASNLPAAIRRNYRRWPNANIGIPTGSENRFFVVEVDTEAGHDVDGIASLRLLQAEHGPLPETLQAISPSGSVHHYFIHPGFKIKNSASEIAPGIDVRGDGGMVLVPPSVKPGVGCYRWLNTAPIANAPAWLIELILSTAKTPSTGRPKQNVDNEKTVINILPKAARPGEPVERDKVKAALDVISSNCGYGQWFEIAAALHFEFGDAGFDLFDTWSARSPQYDAEECAQKWKDVSNVNGFTAATIFHHADKADPRWRDRYRMLHCHDIDWLREMIVRRPADA